MRCLEKFNKKMVLGGGSIRNENIKNSQELLRETFADDASLALGIYFWELGLKSYDDKESIQVRIYKRSFSNANGVTMKFQTLIDTPIIVGDIVYDSVADEYLICTESFNIDGIHWQGKFTLCNWILKWQNKDGDILEYPCHDINATQYNSGERFSQQVTIGSSQHLVILPCDDNTVVLNSPQRFFLDKNIENPTSFIVTQNDNTSYSFGKKGLVRITLMQCENNHATDRFDLGICDYIDKETIKTDNANDVFVSKSVISYETNVIKSGGDLQVFTAKFFDNNGYEITNVIPKWKVICDFEDVLEIEKYNNKISIGVDNDDYIDEEFKLVLSDNDDNYSSTLIIKIESLL